MNAAGPIPHAGSAAPQAEAGPYKGAMTTLGFHYFPDETHYRRADLQAWLPELEAVGARWLTLIGSLTRAVPEPFIKGLFDAGIEPIIHLPAMPTRRDAQAASRVASSKCAGGATRRARPDRSARSRAGEAKPSGRSRSTW